MTRSSLAVVAFLLASLAAAACGAPSIPDMGDESSSSDGITEESADPTPAPAPRASDAGTAPRADGGTKSDASAAADAAPATQTFTVGPTDCNGGHCRAGYDGSKDATELSTATKLCAGHGFARATDFTLVDNQPGGKFCSFRNTSYGCDNSCSGCNPIGTITCAR